MKLGTIRSGLTPATYAAKGELNYLLRALVAVLDFTMKIASNGKML